jgi:8-oxo-dGTP diphosphatase
MAPKVVTAAIAMRDGRVLIARRRAGERLAGLWEFPGGKLEAGETPQSCLARELQEEFGVVARVGAFFMSSIHHYGDGAIDLRAYFVAWPDGSHPLHAHDAVAWVDPDALLAYPLAPADIPIAQGLARRAAAPAATP